MESLSNSLSNDKEHELPEVHDRLQHTCHSFAFRVSFHTLLLFVKAATESLLIP